MSGAAGQCQAAAATQVGTIPGLFCVFGAQGVCTAPEPPPLDKEQEFLGLNTMHKGRTRLSIPTAAFGDVPVGNKIYSPHSELQEETSPKQNKMHSPHPELQEEASPKQTPGKGIFSGFYLLWVIEVTICALQAAWGIRKAPRTGLRPQWVLHFHNKQMNSCPSSHSSQAQGSWWWLLDESEAPKYPSLPRE